MKLNAEEKKKIGLGLILVVGLVMYYFNFLLGPLSLRASKSEKEIAALEPQIKEAEAQIKKTEALEKMYPEKQKVEQQLKNLIPETAPIAWFPPKIETFFAGRDMKNAITRLNAEVTGEGIQNFRKVSWLIEIPEVEILNFAKSISDLENQEPLLSIVGVQVVASTQNVQYQQASLTVHTLLKQ